MERPLRILIIDDDDDVDRMAIRRALKKLRSQRRSKN